MNTKGIVVAIDEEIGKLKQAKELLAGTGTDEEVHQPVNIKKKRHHTVSPEARARISRAVKKRWKMRKQEKKAA